MLPGQSYVISACRAALRETDHFLMHAGAELFAEMLHQQRDVAAAVTQRREGEC